MASLTLYGSNVSDANLSSASSMSTTTGGTEVSVIPTHTGSGLHWLEMTSRAVTVAEKSAMDSPPLGNGWVYKLIIF
jgi:hypothetical protein